MTVLSEPEVRCQLYRIRTGKDAAADRKYLGRRRTASMNWRLYQGEIPSAIYHAKVTTRYYEPDKTSWKYSLGPDVG